MFPYARIRRSKPKLITPHVNRKNGNKSRGVKGKFLNGKTRHPAAFNIVIPGQIDLKVRAPIREFKEQASQNHIQYEADGD